MDRQSRRRNHRLSGILPDLDTKFVLQVGLQDAHRLIRDSDPTAYRRDHDLFRVYREPENRSPLHELTIFIYRAIHGMHA